MTKEDLPKDMIFRCSISKHCLQESLFTDIYVLKQIHIRHELGYECPRICNVEMPLRGYEKSAHEGTLE